MAEHNAARRPPGELEASVLAALWAAGGRPLTPADVQRDLGTALARTTVTTILARLHEKGTVTRTRAGRGYAYLPLQDPAGLAARRMRTELDKSPPADRGTVLARFVSQLSPADEALLRAMLAAQEGPDGQDGQDRQDGQDGVGGPDPDSPGAAEGGSAAGEPGAGVRTRDRSGVQEEAGTSPSGGAGIRGGGVSG